MKKRTLFRNLLVGMTCASALATAYAATQPKFTIIPTTPTSVSLSPNGTATVSYTVTNMTKITRTLVMKPIPGITQSTETAVGPVATCANPFTLASQESCTLNLNLDGNTLPRLHKGGPVICKTQDASNNAPDPFLCSQPTLADSLNIEVMREAFTVEPSSLTLTAGSGIANSMKVTSNLFVRTALNVAADFTNTSLEGNVTQDASDCVRLEPGQSCFLKFTPMLQSITPGVSFPINGTNTSSVGATIEVVNPAQAPISVYLSTDTSSTQMSLQGTTGTPVTQFFTITNNSNVLTATDIAPQSPLPKALTDAGVFVVSNTCASVAPFGTCEIEFSPGTSGAGAVMTGVNIVGTNTSLVTPGIEVVPAVNVSIAFTQGTPLVLQMGGNSGIMTIQNTSGTEDALGVKANISSTSLNGAVTVSYSPANSNNTACGNLAPGASCTMTFRPSATTGAVRATDFFISGDNTSALTGTITVGSFAYILGFSPTGNSSVSQCSLATNGNLINPCKSATTIAGSVNSQGMAVNTAKTLGYVTNSGGNTVSVCTISPSGAFTNCVYSGATGLGAPVGITLNGGFAWITNLSITSPSSTTGISSCTIDGNGQLTCGSAGAIGLNQPSSIAFHPTLAKAYITNSATSGGNSNRVSICNVTGSMLTECADALSDTTVFRAPTTIALNAAGTFAYVTNRSATTTQTQISRCAVNATNGSLSGCGSANAYPVGASYFGIAINNSAPTAGSTGAIAYASNPNPGTAVSNNPINQNQGDFSSTSNSGNSFENSATAIALLLNQ